MANQVPGSRLPTNPTDGPRPGPPFSWRSPPRPAPVRWGPAAHRGPDAEPDTERPGEEEEANADEAGDGEWKAEEELQGVAGDAHQAAQAMGAVRLFDAFHRRHPDGTVPLDELPTLLEEAGLAVTAAQVEGAVVDLWPDGSIAQVVTYQQCQELFLHLQLLRREAEDSDMDKVGGFVCCFSRMSDNQSTNVLLVVVVTLCCISAFLAGGVAILLLMLDDAANVRDHLQENLGVLQDTLEVYAGQIAVQQGNERQAMFITTLGSVLRSIAYSDTMAENTQQLLHVVTSAGNTLGAWWSSLPLQTFTHHGTLAAKLANAATAQYGLNDTAALFDEINAGMPPSWELLLGQWDPSSPAGMQFLTQLRYSDYCWGDCDTSGDTSTTMRAAVAGNTSAGLFTNYAGINVLSGYAPANGFAAQVNLDYFVIVAERLSQVVQYVESWTASSDSWEYIVGMKVTADVLGVLSLLPDCDWPCQEAMVAPGQPLHRALNGETGTMTYTNYRGVPAVAAFAPLPGTSCGLLLHMNVSDIVARTVERLTALVDRLNRDYPSSTEEFEVTAFSGQGNNTIFTRLSAYRYGDQCPGDQCQVAPEYVWQAALNCSTGVSRATDYRGTPVLVGFTCLSEMSVVLSVKLDLADEAANNLAAAVEAVNDRTAKDRQTSTEFAAAVPRAGLTAAEVRDPGDAVVVSRLKFPGSCALPNCTSSTAMRALQGSTEVVETQDYRNVAVLSATSLSAMLPGGLGLAVELDTTEAFQPTYDVAIRVGSFAIGVAVGCTLLLVLITQWLLRSMIRAKEEGRQAVGAEKDRLSRLVASMYPPFVVPRLLAGEKQMVCEVPGAAVFFSDIYEFTSASNTMGSKDLLELMGYVYGIMDRIADRFSVYKVKTIGDAYLAVTGLPGSTAENPSLELLRFAAFVCQVFGDRFVHPPEGQALARMNRAMQWNRSKLQRAFPSRGKDDAESAIVSAKPSSNQSQRHRSSGRPSLPGAGSPRGREPPARCVMSYGLAVGRIVAGVLGGRCPMFDIWGGTVNLASRMQSTGEPGRIQVSEQLYKKVVGVPGQPFSFEAPRSTYCKGFGTVSAYMVRTTAEGLPKDLQEELRLEPRYGAFYFDNLLAASPP